MEFGISFWERKKKQNAAFHSASFFHFKFLLCAGLAASCASYASSEEKQRGERERLPRALLSALAIEIHYVNLPSNRFAVIRVFERSSSARSDVCFRPKKNELFVCRSFGRQSRIVFSSRWCCPGYLVSAAAPLIRFTSQPIFIGLWNKTDDREITKRIFSLLFFSLNSVWSRLDAPASVMRRHRQWRNEKLLGAAVITMA